MARPFTLKRNLSLFGKPGSGKGYYGQPIADEWGVPLISVSSILRQSSVCGEIDLDSGKLVDCETVSTAVLSFLQSSVMHEKHYILDGFPRTIKQIKLMETTWPPERRVHGAFLLDVPDFVCKSKMLGRRHCKVCGKGLNLAAVYREGFDLPAQVPSNCQDCVPDVDWISRKDDVPGIVETRLRIHNANEEPILQYYNEQNALLKYRPYRGKLDLPDMVKSLEAWILHTLDVSSCS